MLALEHRTVLGGQHPDEFRAVAVPVGQDPFGELAPSVLMMAHNQRVNPLYLVVAADRPKFDHPGVAARIESTVIVEHVGDSAAHSGGEIAPGAAEHDHRAARHVLAAMVADTFDDRRRAAVAHRETLAG